MNDAAAAAAREKTRVRVDLGGGISEELAAEIHKKVYYLSDDIDDFRLVVADGEVKAIDLFVNPAAATPGLADWARGAITETVRGIKPFKPRRVWENDGPDRGYSGALFDELVRRGLVHVHGEGQVSIRGVVLALFQFFDSVFAAVSQRIFRAEPYQFPTLLKTSVLADGGYFEKFPHLLMFVTRMKNDPATFAEFKSARDRWNLDRQLDAQQLTCETGYNAPPTMCYYIYDMFRGRPFAGNAAVTAVGKSFRFENKYHHPLTRLWDFTIRETVFFGTDDYVRQSVEGYRRIATSVMERLGLRGFCETASDPFFLGGDTSALVNTQLLLGAKYELKLRVGPEATIAVGSFNLHGQYFAKRFDLRTASPGNEHIFSGCIGIGLERTVFAFLSQFGLDTAQWPEVVRDAVERPEQQDQPWNRLLENEIERTSPTPLAAGV
jgi:hypothetical protein